MSNRMNLLIINPGSTSTKVSIFENGVEKYKKSLSHSSESLAIYKKASDQSDFRKHEIEKFLKEIGYNLHDLSAIVARGGALPPIRMGAYKVNEEMIDVLCNRPIGQHASSTAAIIAYDMAKELGIPSYIYDGNTADEMDEVAKISGCPLLTRKSYGHFLNTKAIAFQYAESLGKKYTDMNLIMVHMGGGISVGLHQNGRIVDVFTDEDGTFSPERAGGLPSIEWAKVCTSGQYNFDELSSMIRGKGGVTAYLKTNDVRKVEEMINQGDTYAKLIYDAMAYQTAKCIGALAAAAYGKVDGIILTGGIAHSKMFTEMVSKRVEFIAKVTIMPGEFEMEALAAGITRVLNGEETARDYKEHEVNGK